jgi:hypothetical protein
MRLHLSSFVSVSADATKPNKDGQPGITVQVILHRSVYSLANHLWSVKDCDEIG